MWGRVGLLTAILGAAAVAAMMGTRSPVALLLAATFVGVTAGPLFARLNARTRARATRIGNVAFATFFALYVTAATVFLLAGLAPAVVRAVPAWHAALHRWGAGPTQTLEIVARGNAFDTRVLALPDRSVQIRFSNLDLGVPHNVAIYDRGDSEGIPVFRG
jgi:hypothetical protein